MVRTCVCWLSWPYAAICPSATEDAARQSNVQRESWCRINSGPLSWQREKTEVLGLIPGGNQRHRKRAGSALSPALLRVFKLQTSFIFFPKNPCVVPRNDKWLLSFTQQRLWLSCERERISTICSTWPRWGYFRTKTVRQNPDSTKQSSKAQFNASGWH